MAISTILLGRVADQSQGQATLALWLLVNLVLNTHAPTISISNNEVNDIVAELDSIGTPKALALKAELLNAL